ncbi:MAG: ActS/PrrB/RegB family redox-sensitive histidine kinase [Alphaproteobacteria bacterium]|jgi:two-component system sensor histidine kinase RegB|uniref:ActS/PrrB/RegB family redox-sensitive histidine kinase n=1 Tax=Pacificispira sp. TaxID=2888761 RepID=UPI001B21F887|nr:ActS/PrrB/RegB family redox-sensitive histidine kinase [Alphaproteobacteria bacterium]MBO6861425.1 ActS/PrrB/RegB family redox-sensitive histidine kinase [Alphaproteobacteria bacterium]MEC9268702.1 ActS/PrrB/RegB family redox-sensitive histidine kinase [Pseudomonadota bacterium]
MANSKYTWDTRPNLPERLPEARRPVGLSLTSLIMLRWIAVAGQMATVLVIHFAFGFDLAVFPCLIAIGALAASNLALMASKRRRLTELRAASLLAFDLLQLASLIGLTGGLQNPFALLLLAPVTVSATILSRRATLALTSLAVMAATFVTFFHLPLPWRGDEGLQLPLVYMLGIWTALTMSIVFMATYVWTASEESRRLSDALSESAAALARERELSALGALAAAAAHELGSPLATIAVVSKELMSEVDKDSPLYEDVELLKSQSDRCREILVGLSHQPDATGDPFETLPLSNLVELAVDEHVPDHVELDILIDESCEGPEPMVRRTPEFLHGLGNFASNAGQYAKKQVWIRIYWTPRDVWISVHDDGPGFSHSVLQMLGEPYMSTRAGQDGHMGLGVFIATTLLERIGGHSAFRNRRGAEALVHWDRDDLEAPAETLL